MSQEIIQPRTEVASNQGFSKVIHSARFRWPGVIVAFGLFVFLWFWFLPYQTISGDDLILHFEASHGIFGSSFLASWVQTHSGKYRPVFSVLFSLEFPLFGENFRAYYAVSLVLQLANGVLICYLGWLFSKRRWLVALMAGFMFLFSRFAYDYVLQTIWGLMEELALLFTLLILLLLFRAYRLKQPRAFAGPVIFFFLATFTHERFLVLVGFLSLAIFLSPAAFKSWKTRFLWASLPVLVVAFNFFVKTFLIDTSITAGRPLSLSPFSILSQMFTGLANILGFNNGVDNLSGKDISETGLTGWLLGFAFLIPGLLLSAGYLWYLRTISRNFRVMEKFKLLRPEILRIFLFLVLFVSLVFSASIAKLQEPRWLYAPYVLLLLGVAYLAGHTALPRLKRPGNVFLAWLFVAALLLDIYYRGYLNNIYLTANTNFTDKAKAVVIDKYKDELKNSDIYIISNSQNLYFIFLGSYWYQVYSKIPNLQVSYVSNIDSIPLTASDGRRPLVFQANTAAMYSGSTVFEDITDQTVAYLNQKKADGAAFPVYFDFIKNFSQGKINKDDPVTSVNGKGAFLMNLPDKIGIVRNLTVLSGYNYRYENLTIKPNSHLIFKAAKIYDIGDSALLYIDATAKDGQTRRILSTTLPPAVKTEVNWQSFNIALPEDLTDDVTLTFGTDSPTGDSQADWVALNSLELVTVSGK